MRDSLHRSSLRQRRGLRPAAGFTLIELAIVLVVAGVLTSLALPAWKASVMRSKRQEAREAIQRVLQQQEHWRGNATAYTAQLSDLSVATASRTGLYALSIADASATGYVVTATAAGGSSQASDSGCTSLVASVSRGNPTYSPAACWAN